MKFLSSARASKVLTALGVGVVCAGLITTLISAQHAKTTQTAKHTPITTTTPQKPQTSTVATASQNAIQTPAPAVQSASTATASAPKAAPVSTPVATPAPQPVSTPQPVVEQGFDLDIDPSKITSDATGYYFPFQIIRKGGFNGKITPSGVFVTPQGTWPNYVEVQSYFMLGADTGAFILLPQMHHPQDVTITFTAFSYPYEASKSFSYHFPNDYY